MSTSPKLSILIPTTPDRKQFVERLFDQFTKQLGEEISRTIKWVDGTADFTATHNYENVEIIVFQDEYEHTIGQKRNVLLDHARGEYIAFVDSDDSLSDDYFKLVLEGIATGADCCSLRGIITEDGANPLVFEHSIKYNEYKTTTTGEVRYERYNNHLNCIKASIAKQFRFPESNFGEDTAWATLVRNSGLIKTEYYIQSIIYKYEYRSKK